MPCWIARSSLLGDVYLCGLMFVHTIRVHYALLSWEVQSDPSLKPEVMNWWVGCHIGEACRGLWLWMWLCVPSPTLLFSAVLCSAPISVVVLFQTYPPAPPFPSLPLDITSAGSSGKWEDRGQSLVGALDISTPTPLMTLPRLAITAWGGMAWRWSVCCQCWSCISLEEKRGAELLWWERSIPLQIWHCFLGYISCAMDTRIRDLNEKQRRFWVWRRLIRSWWPGAIGSLHARLCRGGWLSARGGESIRNHGLRIKKQTPSLGCLPYLACLSSSCWATWNRCLIQKLIYFKMLGSPATSYSTYTEVTSNLHSSLTLTNTTLWDMKWIEAESLEMMRWCAMCTEFATVFSCSLRACC